MKHRVSAPPPATAVLAPLETTLGFWRCCANLAEIWWARHGGMPSGNIAPARLNALVRYARAASPFHRRLYARVPESGAALEDLPSVTKDELMAHFDEWSADSHVKRVDVERFLSDRRRVGEAFQGRYHVWKSSGTTGTPGIFLQDAHAMAVYDALVAAQLDSGSLAGSAPARAMALGGRSALIAATGDHFASATFWERLRRAYPGVASRSFSVLAPIGELVAQLNEYQPAYVAAYPSVLSLLATERAAGRLRIAPALLWSGGEFLAQSAREAIERAFECRVMNEYGASECLCIGSACREGWMHVNSEWVIVEGVDERGRRTPPGEISHTVLITNLANWSQPIIRYDLGDRVVALPAACACGDARPAFRVEGRTDEVVALRTSRGDIVRLPPLAISTVVEETAGPHRFQIAQTAPDELAVRLDRNGSDGTRALAWKRTARALHAYLSTHALANVHLRLDRGPPRIDGRSGKLRSVTGQQENQSHPR